MGAILECMLLRWWAAGPSYKGGMLRKALWEGGGANECCYIRGTIPVSYGAHFLRNVCFIDKQQEVTAHKLANLNGYFL